jgi:endonuclease YncB( thermonuclease family)
VSLDDDIKISVRVRIIDIDTPEINGECDLEKVLASRAKDRLTELLPIGSIVELSDVKDDKYLGRIDARVKNANGLNISEILIGEKLARPYGGGRRGSWCGAESGKKSK